jgi:hypothetical protein
MREVGSLKLRNNRRGSEDPCLDLDLDLAV